MVNQLDCISNIYCYKSKSNKNTKLIVNIIYYIIIFLPLIIGMTIGGIYGQKWKEDKYKNIKKPKLYPPNYVFSIVWPILYLIIGGVYSYSLYDFDCKPFGMSKCGMNIYYKKIIYWILPTLALIFNFLYIPVFFSENGFFNSFIIIVITLILSILTLIQFSIYRTFSMKYIQGIYIFGYMIYIVWLLYATYLSYNVYILNKN